jgi:hypothetical protein
MKRLLPAIVLSCVTACGGGNSTPTQPNNPAPPIFQIPNGVSALVASMYQQLPAYIGNALAENQANLPLNPQNASFINAKIALLQRPTLAVEIADGRMFAERAVTSIDERRIDIATLFAEERMRGEAMQAIHVVGEALPILERFLDTPFPASSLRVWYGFKVGNSGGGGSIFSEDRTSYEARTSGGRLPFDAILSHELAHSYIGNEILNQFLELYVLDVYQMPGHEAVARAYKAACALRPPYGQPLSPAVRQAFVDQAPTHLKSSVDDKLNRITF